MSVRWSRDPKDGVGMRLGGIVSARQSQDPKID